MKFKNKEELSKAYDELEKKFTQVCQEIKDLKEQLKLVENKEIWQPKKGEKYWTIGIDGCVWQTSNDGDDKIFEIGNYFKSKEEAEKQAEYNKVMNRFRKYCEGHSKPLDWENGKQCKHSVIYNRSDKEIQFCGDFVSRYAFQIYASSEQIIKEAIIYSAGSEEEFIRVVFNEKKL